MSSAQASVSASELHDPTNTRSSLNVAPGVSLTDLQAYHVGIVLDIFQGKGTRGKLVDAFSEDAVYEDLFATCKNREEVAGQLVNLPKLLASAKTNSHQITSVTRGTTDTGSRQGVSADEIKVRFNHTFTFLAHLPLDASSITMDSTLIIWSAADEKKIIRLQDRPMEEIPTNSFITAIRKLNAVGVPKITSLPKNDKEDAESVLRHQR